MHSKTNSISTLLSGSGYLLGLGLCASLAYAAPAKRKTPPTQPPAKTKAPLVRKAPAAHPTPKVPAKPAARPTAKTVAKPAARRLVKPVIRPVARKVVKPVVRKVAKHVARKVAKPVARKVAKPVVRKVAKRVVSRRVPVVRPQAKSRRVVSTQTHYYTMHFKKKMVGRFSRTEKTWSDGSHEVTNQSKMNIKMLFTTVKASNQSQSFYDKSNRLISFTITSTVRGRVTKFIGKRDAKGLTITKEADGKKMGKPKTFPEGSFQGTSLDFRFPTAPAGVRIRRQYLVIPRRQIVEQDLTFRQAPSREVFGKRQPVFEISIKNNRGRGTVLVTRDGAMVASRMHGRLGVVEIRLK